MVAIAHKGVDKGGKLTGGILEDREGGRVAGFGECADGGDQGRDGAAFVVGVLDGGYHAVGV